MRSETDPKAIIYGKRTCAEDFSLYKAQCASRISEYSRKSVMDFVDWKQEGFNSRMATEITNIKFFDEIEFYKTPSQ